MTFSVERGAGPSHRTPRGGENGAGRIGRSSSEGETFVLWPTGERLTPASRWTLRADLT
jgi:hypothetical protein